jgi:hypothetical protein
MTPDNASPADETTTLPLLYAERARAAFAISQRRGEPYDALFTHYAALQHRIRVLEHTFLATTHTAKDDTHAYPTDGPGLDTQ